jgi:phenylalanine-4-hydroxylase
MLQEGYIHAALPSDRCPDALEVSGRLHALNGWRLTDATNPYLSDEDRYAPLHGKHFPATNYIRSMEDLAFTPLPDLAHDYFGHMPQIFHPQLSCLQWRIADMFMRARDDKKKELYSLAWYVIEYSVVKEDGIPKIF